jgi:hypothetical protein
MATGALPAKGLMCGKLARRKCGEKLMTPRAGAELMATAALA